jgi:hypothetical protein
MTERAKEFEEIRATLVALGYLSGCRETAPYRFTQNGGTKRVRAPGAVFQVISEAAGKPLPCATSWCGKWPRTVSSLRDETAGEAQFWAIYDAL